MTDLRELKQNVLMTAKKAYDEKLMAGTSGNISAYFREKQWIVITPSSYDYSLMAEEDIVVIDLDGNLVEGRHKPSSEWKMHAEIYRKDLCEIIRGAAADLQIPLQEGTYIQLSGPNFETPHEVKMCRILGGDAVGMSTACEAIAANHMGMKVCGISCISNLGCGMTDQPLSAEEVKETADRVAPLFKQLITESIVRIGKMI